MFVFFTLETVPFLAFQVPSRFETTQFGAWSSAPGSSAAPHSTAGPAEGVSSTPYTFLPVWPSSTVMLHNAVSDEMTIFRFELQRV